VAEVEYVRALERGLAIFQVFSARTPVLTVSDVAKATGLTRATARRFLHTLEQLEFVRRDERGAYSLTPKVLSLGHAYISSSGVGPIATPRINALAAELRETVNVATFHDTYYVIVARAESDRLLTPAAPIGSTSPAHVSALGKVLLAELPDNELDGYFARATLTRFTSHTLTDEQTLRAELAKVRAQGWAVSDQELEEGLLSVGVPLYRNGQVIAALNATSHTGRQTLAGMIDDLLPRLLDTAKSISEDLALTS
jgi:IclR family pca regulon transcriptional regulator